MSIPRPATSAKTPASKLARPSGLAQPRSGIPTPGSLSRAQSPDPPAPPSPPPVDDYIIGDRVFVSGTKPGYIAFLGETQFAPGEWAGVVLDEAFGKNDGSVSGVRYFQCEAKRGVFCRISKLLRTPGIVPSLGSHGHDNHNHSEAGGEHNGTMPQKRPTTPSIPRPTTPSIPRPTTPSGLRPTTPSGLRSVTPRTSVSKSLSGSNSSLNQGHAPTPAPVMSMSMPASGMKYNLKMGDRVLVSGTKPGTLRYIGSTDFAKGDWAGVELDDPMGKNDGAVAGKRYFECKPRYGLFAPVHKVTKVTGSAGASPQARTTMNSSRLSRERSGSQESVSSLSSTASSVSRSRAKTSQRPSSLNLSATTSALQKALKEKEEHIEQLLRERDLERAEVARAAAQVDETESKISQMQSDQERVREDSETTIIRLKGIIQELEKEKHGLLGKLEDEKRKVEDLQFQIEEEVISKDDLESRTEEEEVRIREMEKSLKKERERGDKLHEELVTLKALVDRQSKEMKSKDDLQTTYLDQIEELTHKLSQAENKIKSFDSNRLEEGAKTSQVSLELAEKSARVKELEDMMTTRDKEIKHLHSRLVDTGEEIKSSFEKREKMQKTMDDLTSRLDSRDAESQGLSTEVQKLKSQISDLEIELDSKTKTANDLTEEKNMLERQIGEVMKNSGDSSQKLSMLNEQLAEKTRKIGDLQADLSSSTQKLARLNGEYERVKAEKDKEINILSAKNEEISNSFQNKLEDVQKELDKSRSKIKEMEDDFEKDKENLTKRKDSELTELHKQLENMSENLNKQEIQTQAHKQVLDQITMEKEALQFEKEKIEKHIKRLETDKEGLNSELIQAKVEMSKAQSKCQEAVKNRENIDEQLQDITEEKERLVKIKAELQVQKDELVSERDKVSGERDQIQRDLMDTKATLQQKDMRLEELQKEVERLRQETSQQQETLTKLTAQESSVSSTLQQQLEESQKSAIQLQGRLSEIEAERNDAQGQLKRLSQNFEESKVKIEQQNDVHNKELEDVRQRHREEVESLELDKAILEEKVDNSNSILQQKTKDQEVMQSQMSILENENSLLSGYKSLNQKLEKEKEEMTARLRDLERKLADSETNANIIRNSSSTDNSLVAKLKEEKESSDHQLSFLNSVIVDLQKKNDDLKIRLEAMESGVVNGANGDAMEMEIASPTNRAPPRMFCDICDVFDQHETEDCPLQEMSDSPPPTQYHGDRHSVRPYCDICEEFHVPCPGFRKNPEALAEIVGHDATTIAEDWTKNLYEGDVGKQNYDSDPDMYFIHEPGGARDSGYYDGCVEGKRHEAEGEDNVFTKLRESLKPFIQDSMSDLITGEISEKDIVKYQKMLEKAKNTADSLLDSSEVLIGKNIGMKFIRAADDDDNDGDDEGMKSSPDESDTSTSLNISSGIVSQLTDGLSTESPNDDTSDGPSTTHNQSLSEGDFQSGKESLTSDDVEADDLPLDSPTESSVDSGEVFVSESPSHRASTNLHTGFISSSDADHTSSLRQEDPTEGTPVSKQTPTCGSSDKQENCMIS